MSIIRIFFVAATVAVFSSACAHEPSPGVVRSILNEGVLVEQGESKILFDPIYDNGFNAFPEQSVELKEAIISGLPPYDDVEAIFVSHYHDDHFSIPNMIRLLKAQESVRLYAPQQAVEALKADDNWDAPLIARVISIVLQNEDAAMVMSLDAMTIEALRTPHTGWPEYHKDVENITFRITMPEGARVMHLGDADKNPEFFKPHENFFERAQTHMGFAPFWFFEEEESILFLEEALNIDHAVGIHVPIDVPDYLKEDGKDYFSTEGEVRTLPVNSDHKH